MAATGALFVVDVQNDFCPGGTLPVSEGDKVVPLLNDYILLFREAGLPVYLTRDWHPASTRHFQEFGGVWPPHCVQDTKGAEFHPDLKVLLTAVIVSKGMDPNEDSYSAFQGVDEQGLNVVTSLRHRGVDHIYIGGLATDYCVRYTALDALKEGFKITVLEDAIQGVDLTPGDSERALEEIRRAGAKMARLTAVAAALSKKQGTQTVV